jgi:LacI family transcriptional regulator
VSPGTVSNVLNRPELVRTKTRERVDRAIALLGYRPNRQARMLAGGRDHGIGLVVHDAGNPFFARIADAVAAAAEGRGFSVVMTSSRADEARQEAAMRLLLEHQLSGILLTPTVHPPTELATLAAGTPVVLLDYPVGTNECSVHGNDVRGGRIAAAHMIEIGRRQLCFVGGPRRVQQHRDRAKGIREKIRATPDAEPLRVVAVGMDTIDAGYAATTDVLALRDGIDGVLCGNDLLAIGLMKGLTDHGLRLPQDLPVIGYDDIALAGLVSIPLTTVHQPIAQIGAAATELLLDEITKPDQHKHRRMNFDPHLVVRESTSHSPSPRLS